MRSARIRVSMFGLLILDMDVKTLIVNHLVNSNFDFRKFSKENPIAIETTACDYTQCEIFVQDDDD